MRQQRRQRFKGAGMERENKPKICWYKIQEKKHFRSERITCGTHEAAPSSAFNIRG
jgi:hypothetical protein